MKTHAMLNSLVVCYFCRGKKKSWGILNEFYRNAHTAHCTLSRWISVSCAWATHSIPFMFTVCAFGCYFPLYVPLYIFVWVLFMFYRHLSIKMVMVTITTYTRLRLHGPWYFYDLISRNFFHQRHCDVLCILASMYVRVFSPA